jgi:rare lipoprotein A
MDRDQTSDPASAPWHGRHRPASPACDEHPPLRACRRRPLLAPASSALAGLLATAALISAACSGNHRPATSASAGTPIERGTASWYGPKFDGRRTASGERYDMRSLTAAHPTLPFGTLVQVTNLVNGRQVVVRINDRGPFAHRRIIDLSYKAALELEIVGPGTAQVELAIVGHGDLLPPLPMPAPPIVVAAVDTPAAPSPGAPSPSYRTVEAAATAAPNAGALDAALDEPRSEDAGDSPEPRAAELAPGMAPAMPPAPVLAVSSAKTAGRSADASPVQRAATAAAAAPAGGGAHFTVQVGAFGEPGRADALRRDLARTYPETAVHSDGLWSRVQIGLFGDREQAETLRRELAATGIAAIVVTAR